jgi:hypothetical protein
MSSPSRSRGRDRTRGRLSRSRSRNPNRSVVRSPCRSRSPNRSPSPSPSRSRIYPRWWSGDIRIEDNEDPDVYDESDPDLSDYSDDWPYVPPAVNMLDWPDVRDELDVDERWDELDVDEQDWSSATHGMCLYYPYHTNLLFVVHCAFLCVFLSL